MYPPPDLDALGGVITSRLASCSPVLRALRSGSPAIPLRERETLRSFSGSPSCDCSAKLKCINTKWLVINKHFIVRKAGRTFQVHERVLSDESVAAVGSYMGYVRALFLKRIVAYGFLTGLSHVIAHFFAYLIKPTHAPCQPKSTHSFRCTLWNRGFSAQHRSMEASLTHENNLLSRNQRNFTHKTYLCLLLIARCYHCAF